MNFPTADEIAAFIVFVRLTAIHKLITEARPELTELIGMPGPQLALTIDVQASPSGGHNRVVLVRGRGYFPHWLIVESRSYDLVITVWDLETADDQVRDALLATYDACLAKSEIAVHRGGRNRSGARSFA